MASILLVEDDENLVRLLDIYLRKSYQIATAASGEAAEALLVAQPFDLAIMDLMLVDGPIWNLLTLIQQNYPALKTIVMTGSTDQNLLDRATALGVKHFLAKPTTPADIKKAIEALL